MSSGPTVRLSCTSRMWLLRLGCSDDQGAAADYGARFLVELEVVRSASCLPAAAAAGHGPLKCSRSQVMPGEMTVQRSHDIALALQQKVGATGTWPAWLARPRVWTPYMRRLRIWKTWSGRLCTWTT